MKTILPILFVLSFTTTNAQTTIQIMDENNVSAIVSDIGVYFNNFNTTTPGYELPKGSLKNLIYSSAFWYGGVDVNGQLKLSAQNLSSTGIDQDIWPGTLAIGTASPIIDNGPTIWAVSKAEIDAHLQNYQQPGYVTPSSILNWPAHGDIAQGASFYLAPFFDNDGDGVYDPSSGDYPCIKGDYAAFIIMNDRKDLHATGADPIGIEVHLMFYQFATTDALNNTTFVDVDIFNRGTQTIYDFTNSFVLDGDLGNPTDDFVGCDTTRNLLYYYNDANDENNVGAIGYGTMPPSFGVVCLNQKMTSAILLDGPNNYPSSPLDHYQAMNGISWTGAPYLDPSNNPTKFQYFDNPSNSNGWSEITAGNSPGDKRALMSVNLNTLIPNDHKSLTYAVIFNQGISNIESVNGLMDVCDSIQLFADQYTSACDTNTAGIIEKGEEIDFSMYPNPSSDFLFIELKDNNGFEVVIRSLDGKEVRSMQSDLSKVALDLNGLASGMYIIQLKQKGVVTTKQFVKIN